MIAHDSPASGLIRRLRRRWHGMVAGTRRDGGVRLRAAPGWTLAVDPGAYEEMRYWLRYEAGTFAALRRLWRPGLRVLDIGAHVGEFALACLPEGHPPAAILAVEPSADCWELLGRNRRVHAAADWRIEKVAVGDHEGEVALEPGEDAMLRVPRGGRSGEISVPLTTADRLCAACGFEPELIKMDIEGYEAEALRGCRALLQRRPPVFLEWHRTMLRARGILPEEALEPLAEAGYRFEVCESGSTLAFDAAALARVPDAESYRLLCQA